MKIPILIVGSGPTGLMLANQLTRFGADYIIIDGKAGPTDQSRALVVQARSMEIYEQMGLSDQVIADGQKGDGINLYTKGKLKATLNLGGSGAGISPFPFVMIYEQSKNEKLLYNNLRAQGKEVEWNTSVVSITLNGEGYVVTCKKGDNTIEYQCTYLIGCDGSKSAVREYAQVPFTGGTYYNIFYVADTHIDTMIDDSKLSLFLTKQRISMLFPMKGEKHVRVLGILPKEFYHHEEIPFEQILTEVKKDMQLPAEFYDTGWHSTYKLHHKKVASFRKDNIFLAGDAAHVHSPAGGQGMNTGLQDAYNLGWKLAMVQKGMADKKLLDTYHEERNPVATALLKSTDRMFTGMIKATPWWAFVRTRLIPSLVPLVNRFSPLRRAMFKLVSQVQINYRGSSLSSGKAGKIKGGDRCPYFMVEQARKTISIYELIRGNSRLPFTIITYNADPGKFDPALYNLIVLEKNDANDKALKAVGLPKKFVMVVRPDNYVGWVGEKGGLLERPEH